MLLTHSCDPRPALSRARLLDAAISLLRSNGPSAVTVDSVTRCAKVARATLYRHFPCFDDLLAASFAAALPIPPTSPQAGSLRERLIKVLTDQADSMASAPTILTALCWLELRNQLDRSASTQAAERTSSEHLEGLRARVAAYRDPVEVIFDSPEAAHALGSFDRAEALALLVGPILLGNLAAQSTFDYHRCARQAVDGFLKVHAKCS